MSKTSKDQPKGSIPGLTLDDDAEIRGDAPDDAAPDDDADDVLAPFDEEDGQLGVADDDTIGVDEDDNGEREAP